MLLTIITFSVQMTMFLSNISSTLAVQAEPYANVWLCRNLDHLENKELLSLWLPSEEGFCFGSKPEMLILSVRRETGKE